MKKEQIFSAPKAHITEQAAAKEKAQERPIIYIPGGTDYLAAFLITPRGERITAM